MDWQKITIIVISFLLLLSSGCINNTFEPTAAERVLIETDDAALNDVVTYYDNHDLAIAPLDSDLVSMEKSTTQDTLILKLRARIRSPYIGHTLHCNHVTIDGNYAYVSFHTPEDDYRGAVYIVDISNPQRPRLVCIGKFLDTDITIAQRHDQVLYLGEATDSEHNSFFESPAAVEAIKLSHGILTTESRRIDLPGYNGNDIVASGNKLYVTSGTTDGGLTVLNQSDMSILKTIPIDAAKACGLYKDEIVVMVGTGTALNLYDKDSYALTRTIALDYPNTFQAKAEIDIDGNWLFLSAYESGMKIVNIKEGIKRHCVRVENNGHCNAVSADGDLVFMANGSEGVYVVKWGWDWIKIVGRIEIDASTNYVATRGNMLFVATGDQGFLVIEIIRGNNDG